MTCLLFSGLLETRLCARTFMNQSADRCGKTLPKANGGWEHRMSSLPITKNKLFKQKDKYSLRKWFVSIWTCCWCCILSPLFVFLHSKPLMQRPWSATWGACSWAAASAAASMATTRCPAPRAELRPRASLWTVPLTPWRTVSDTSDALCRRAHIQHLLPPLFH